MLHYRREIMPTAPLRASILVALVTLLPLATDAAAKPFAGPPSGWDHTVNSTPSAEAPRAAETWRKSGELIAYLSDAALSYDDMVAMVKKTSAATVSRPAWTSIASATGGAPTRSRCH